MASSEISRAPGPGLRPAPARSWGSGAGPAFARSEGARGAAARAAQPRPGASAGQRHVGGRKSATDVVQVTLARRPPPVSTVDSVDMRAHSRSPLSADGAAGRLQHAQARRGSLQPAAPSPPRAGRFATFAVFERHLDQILAEAALDSSREAPVDSDERGPGPPPAAAGGHSPSQFAQAGAAPGAGAVAVWMPRSTGWRDWRG